MRTIQDSTEPNSDSSVVSEDRASEKNSGWQADVSKDTKKRHPDLIRVANEKLPLSDLLKIYKIEFPIVVYSPSGWTHKCPCPFPDHKDTNPSFNYNSIEDRFNCFGCRRSGKAVQFKAAMHGLSQMEVAESIIEQYSSFEDAYTEIKDRVSDKTDEMLFEFSSYVRSFLNKYYGDKGALAFADNVTWNLDVYLQKHLTSPSLNAENLEARINILKEKLDEYQTKNK